MVWREVKWKRKQILIQEKKSNLRKKKLLNEPEHLLSIIATKDGNKYQAPQNHMFRTWNSQQYKHSTKRFSEPSFNSFECTI